VQVSAYDLGVKPFVEPGRTGRFARIPIRLWGVVAVPAGTGPAPVVVIAHGRHGDNCPGGTPSGRASRSSSATTSA